MSSIIALLMLALSLLQAVQSNPDLPQPVKDQAVALATYAITQASEYKADQSLSTPASASPSLPAVGGTIEVMAEIAVYKLAVEPTPDVYYAGDKEIVSATIDGDNATILTSKYFPDDSYVLPDGEKKKGYWMARIAATSTDPKPVVLTAVDGSTYSGTPTVIN